MNPPKKLLEEIELQDMRTNRRHWNFTLVLAWNDEVYRIHTPRTHWDAVTAALHSWDRSDEVETRAPSSARREMQPVENHEGLTKYTTAVLESRFAAFIQSAREREKKVLEIGRNV